MTFEQLVTFLKDNLKIEIDAYCAGVFTVNLRLCGEVISSDSYQDSDSNSKY